MVSGKSKAMRTAKQLIVISVLALASAACGGGGSSVGVAVIPPPPPPPPPPAAAEPAIIPTAVTSQEFVTVGAAYSTPAAAYSEIDVEGPSFAAADQLHVRYSAATQQYEVLLPAATNWSPIHETASYANDEFASSLYRADFPQDFGAFHYQTPANLQYSALISWFTDSRSGYSAIGIPTAGGAVPVSGTAAYSGFIAGGTTETFFDPWEAVYFVGLIRGTIDLSFNFGTGNLTGSISPMLGGEILPSLVFTNTVYSTGSTTFSGAFGTALPGISSFSGRFTGPAAQEVIGNFAFPYISPTSGGTEQAAGAFAGRRP